MEWGLMENWRALISQAMLEIRPIHPISPTPLPATPAHGGTWASLTRALGRTKHAPGRLPPTVFAFANDQIDEKDADHIKPYTP